MEQKLYGVNDRKDLIDEIQCHVEEIKINGFSIIDNILSDDDLTVCRLKIDTVYQMQLDNFGESNLRQINELNLVRCPLLYDDYFLKIATNNQILEIVENILGDYYILHLQNGIINKPNEEHHQSSWHRDLPYQNFVSSKPLAIGALFCIDDFTNDSGGTFVLPHSHKVESFPSIQFVEKFSKQIIAKAGSVLLFDSMLFHKAGFNSANFTRRAINNVYTIPILKQQINLQQALVNKYIEDKFLSKFLGYDSNVAPTDKHWRHNKLSK